MKDRTDFRPLLFLAKEFADAAFQLCVEGKCNALNVHKGNYADSIWEDISHLSGYSDWERMFIGEKACDECRRLIIENLHGMDASSALDVMKRLVDVGAITLTKSSSGEKVANCVIVKQDYQIVVSDDIFESLKKMEK